MWESDSCSVTVVAAVAAAAVVDMLVTGAPGMMNSADVDLGK